MTNLGSNGQFLAHQQLNQDHLMVGSRVPSAVTIRQDLESIIASLEKSCAEFEKLATAQKARVGDLEKLREVLRVLNAPIPLPPERS